MEWKTIAMIFAIAYCSEVVFNGILEIIDRIDVKKERLQMENDDKELMEITKHMYS